MSASARAVVVVLSLLWIHNIAAQLTSCERSQETEPLSDGEVRVLVLVPWPDESNTSGWDDGPALLAAGRVAQKEVNENADLLPNHMIRLIERGHEPCGLYETSCGIMNLVNYGIHKVHPVAVAGLYCSTSAIALTGVAGREEVNLLQLSASNSPAFESSNVTTFPRLWRFLKSSSIYSDMVINLMDQFSWSNITLVQDFDSIFYAAIAEKLYQQIDNTSDKQILYTASVFGQSELLEDVLINIRNTETRVIVAISSSLHLAELLCLAHKYDMHAPEYQWIIVDFLPEHLERENQCNISDLYSVLEGSLMTYYQLHPMDNSTILVSGKPYSEFLELYQDELERVRVEFNDPTLGGDPLYGGLLYDQIWALVLALNNSLPEIRDNNISLSDPGLNRLEITEIIEDEFLDLDFQGATNRIRFNKERDISTVIDIFQIVERKAIQVGSYFEQNGTNVLNLTLGDDEIEIRQQTIVLPLAIAMYVISGLVTVWVFVMMCLLLYYRNEPEIKATSPPLSLLMYVGCYLLCIASFGRILLGTETDHFFYTINCNVQIVLIVNGFNFLFLTLMAKLLRVNYIFNNAKLKKLGTVWKNKVLATIICLVALMSNAVFVVWFTIDPLRLEKNREFTVVGNNRYINVYAKCVSSYSLLWYLIYITYQVILVILTVVVTVYSRRIPYENFKDTKKTNFFVFVIVISYISFVCSWWITRELNLVDIANFLAYAIMLIGVVACQVILFVPKFRTLVFSSVKRRASVISQLYM